MSPAVPTQLVLPSMLPSHLSHRCHFNEMSYCPLPFWPSLPDPSAGRILALPRPTLLLRCSAVLWGPVGSWP